VIYGENGAKAGNGGISPPESITTLGTSEMLALTSITTVPGCGWTALLAHEYLGV